MTVQVWHQLLRQTANGWEQQGDALYGAGKSLTSASDGTSLLGSRVASVASSFIATWTDTVSDLRTEADQHSASLTQTAQEFVVSDTDTVEAMQRLLAWTDRDSVPVTPGSPR